MADETLQRIFRLYEGLELLAPGDDAVTRRALDALGPLPDRPRILDVGCGTGRQTLVLARETGAPVEAVDVHAPFLATLREKARAEGLEVHTREASMDALPYPDGAFDVVWSEGAAYLIGFRRALDEWRRLLAPEGGLAISDAVWRTDDPPVEARDFWQAGYPDMTDVAGLLAHAKDAGYEVVDHFPLPASAWDAYYAPLEERMAALRPSADPVMDEVLSETEREIQMFRRYGESYGYELVVLRKA